LFENKEAKKLHPLELREAPGKSFLILFFKKEHPWLA
jgi:hypothetical protein